MWFDISYKMLMNGFQIKNVFNRSFIEHCVDAWHIQPGSNALFPRHRVNMDTSRCHVGSRSTGLGILLLPTGIILMEGQESTKLCQTGEFYRVLDFGCLKQILSLVCFMCDTLIYIIKHNNRLPPFGYHIGASG